MWTAIKLLTIYAAAFFILLYPTQAFARINPICHTRSSQEFRCHSYSFSDDGVTPHTGSTPEGYSPVQLLGAYKLLPNAKAGTTIAIVDAYDNPNILNDLKFYSATFGIPEMESCPVSSKRSGCFQKVNQQGGQALPKADQGWGLEEALDVETVHALCQNCNVLLIEADDPSFSNLVSAFDLALRRRVKVISNSYGSPEFSGEVSLDKHFRHTGVAMVFSAGDSGYGVEYPAASRYVTAVGGTTLHLSGSSYLGESAWSGSGSGCSKYEGKPSWQSDLKCPKRSVADISADADPETGMAVYDSFGLSGKSGWFKLGGTSLAAPIIASTYALGGIKSRSYQSSLPYNGLTSLNDITGGRNGRCKISYLCKGQTGYDGPTGLGSPIGIAAF